MKEQKSSSHPQLVDSLSVRGASYVNPWLLAVAVFLALLVGFRGADLSGYRLNIQDSLDLQVSDIGIGP
jgi:hypothetical protein